MKGTIAALAAAAAVSAQVSNIIEIRLSRFKRHHKGSAKQHRSR